MRLLRRAAGQRRRILQRSLLGVVVFGVSVLPHAAVTLIPFLEVQERYNRPGTLTRMGDPSPDFDVSTVDRTPFRTTDLRGRVIVLSFFATWCGPCQLELPHLQAIWNEFQDNGDFRMLVIGRGESDDRVRAFRKEHHFTLPLASDPDGSVYRKFATECIPRTYLISRQGTIIYQCAGHYEEEVSKLKSALRKELAK